MATARGEGSLARMSKDLDDIEKHRDFWSHDRYGTLRERSREG